MNNVNNNLFISSFDIEVQGPNKKKPSYLFATLSIIYDKSTLQIKFFNYKIMKMQIKLSSKERKNKSEGEKSLKRIFLESIGKISNKANLEKFITLNQNDLHKLNRTFKNHFPKLNSIYKFILRFDLSWKNIKSSKKFINSNLNKFHFRSTYYYLFEIMSNIDDCEYHDCDDILQDKQCTHYKLENYFDLYDNTSLNQKLDFFSKQIEGKFPTISNTLLIKNWINNKNNDEDDFSKVKYSISTLLDNAYNEELISKSDLNNYKKEIKINNNKIYEVLKNFSTIILKNKQYEKKNEDYIITKIQQMVLTNAYSDLATSKTIQLNKNKENNDKVDNNFPLHNIIFYGVPGTGKTYYSIITAFWILQSNLKVDKKQSLKEQVEKWLKKEKLFEIDIEQKIINNKDIQDQLKIITFHQGYGYEDFIEGIRPILVANNQKENQVNFQINDGIFKKMVENAKNNPDKKYVLIIDEINRGNLSKIFGECFTLIESNKRLSYEKNKWNGIWKVTLPNSGNDFSIPNNIYIIGTMNYSDYSITHFDFALRRRFIFEEIMPDKTQIQNKKAQNIFIKLNEKIKSILDPDKQIGHSYFMLIKEDDDFNFVWKNQIQPLLKHGFHLNEEDLEEIEKIWKSEK